MNAAGVLYPTSASATVDGAKVVANLQLAFWQFSTTHHLPGLIDSNLLGRDFFMPEIFHELFGFQQAHKIKSHKRVLPLTQQIVQTCADYVDKAIDNLPGNATSEAFAKELAKCRDCLLKKVQVLEVDASRHDDNRSSNRARGPRDLGPVLGEKAGIVVHEAAIPAPPEYKEIDATLQNSKIYDPVDLGPFILPKFKDPAMSQKTFTAKRREWVRKITVSVPIIQYNYVHRGNIAGHHVVAKLPAESPIQQDITNWTSARMAQTELYATRADKQVALDFLESLPIDMAKLPRGIVDKIFTYFTGEKSALNDLNLKQHLKRIDDIMAMTMSSEYEGEEVLLPVDLRCLGGKKEEPGLQDFWDALQEVFSNNASNDATERRRHDENGEGQTSYMSKAMRDLQDQCIELLVKKKLPSLASSFDIGRKEEYIRALEDESVLVPSIAHMSHQFKPPREGDKSARRFKGRFNIKRCAQANDLGVYNADSHFALAQILCVPPLPCSNRGYLAHACLDFNDAVGFDSPFLLRCKCSFSLSDALIHAPIPYSDDAGIGETGLCSLRGKSGLTKFSSSPPTTRPRSPSVTPNMAPWGLA